MSAVEPVFYEALWGVGAGLVMAASAILWIRLGLRVQCGLVVLLCSLSKTVVVGDMGRIGAILGFAAGILMTLLRLAAPLAASARLQHLTSLTKGCGETSAETSQAELGRPEKVSPRRASART